MGSNNGREETQDHLLPQVAVRGVQILAQRQQLHPRGRSREAQKRSGTTEKAHGGLGQADRGGRGDMTVDNVPSPASEPCAPPSSTPFEAPISVSQSGKAGRKRAKEKVRK